MIWMQNLIEMKKNAIVMVLEVLIMSQTFSLFLNLILKYFFETILIMKTVPEHLTHDKVPCPSLLYGTITKLL